MFVFFAFLFCLGLSNASSLDPCESGTDLHEAVCLPKNYSYIYMPEDKVEVSLDIWIRTLVEVSTSEQSVEFVIDLSESWTDPNVVINQEYDFGPSGMLAVEYHQIENIWKPDLYLKGIREFTVNKVFDPMVALYVRKDNEIVLWSSSVVKIACPMDFSSFPFDVQNCDIAFSSTSQPIEKMVFTSKIQFDEETNSLQTFDVSLSPLTHTEVTYNANTTFSETGATMRLTRHSGPFLIRHFVPCAGMVVLSWIGFLIPPQAVPGRVGLLVTLFLVLIAYFGSIQAQTPQSNSVTALAIFVIVDIFFVFFAMIEFAVDLFIIRHKTKDIDLDMENSSLKLRGSDTLCNRIDRAALFFFPLTYLIFVFVYAVRYSA